MESPRLSSKLKTLYFLLFGMALIGWLSRMSSTLQVQAGLYPTTIPVPTG